MTLSGAGWRHVVAFREHDRVPASPLARLLDTVLTVNPMGRRNDTATFRHPATVLPLNGGQLSIDRLTPAVPSGVIPVLSM